MKPVEQTRFYEAGPPIYRGNCVAACLASIFELPIEDFPQDDNYSELHTWVKERYPGIAVQRKEYFEPHPDYPYEYVNVTRSEPPMIPGYWIAGVESPRFSDQCARCKGTGKIEALRPSATALNGMTKVTIRCVHCNGDRIVPGLHAVVMKGTELVWDPHPQRDMGRGHFRTETEFIVVDPARLIAA